MKQINNKLITVFTPTYNRGYIIESLYNSLLKQTCQDFKWIIVDDGSSDNTEEKVLSWINEKKLDITYFKQDNSGKHVAHNKGVELCDTEYFFCIDSDDHLTEEAIEKIKSAIKKEKEFEDTCGIIFRRGYNKKKVIGKKVDFNNILISTTDLYERKKFSGDLALIYRTQILKQYLFPVFEGEKFVTEAVIYDRIALKYKMLFIDEIIYIGEYLEDGYTKNIKEVFKKSPNGYKLWLEQRIELEVNCFSKIKKIAVYIKLANDLDIEPDLSKYKIIEKYVAVFIYKSYIFLNKIKSWKIIRKKED